MFCASALFLLHASLSAYQDTSNTFFIKGLDKLPSTIHQMRNLEVKNMTSKDYTIYKC